MHWLAFELNVKLSEVPVPPRSTETTVNLPLFRAEKAPTTGAARTYTQFSPPSGCENVRLGGSTASEQRDGREQSIASESRSQNHSRRTFSHLLPAKFHNSLVLFKETHFVANVL